jgi:hypothetical protein
MHACGRRRRKKTMREKSREETALIEAIAPKKALGIALFKIQILVINKGI